MSLTKAVPVLSLLLLATPAANLHAGELFPPGWFERMQCRLQNKAEQCKTKFTRHHRAFWNQSHYPTCPPYWMANHGYYSTCWRQFPEIDDRCPPAVPADPPVEPPHPGKTPPHGAPPTPMPSADGFGPADSAPRPYEAPPEYEGPPAPGN